MSDETIEAIYQHQTDSAVCIRKVEDGPDVWLPLNHVTIEKKDAPYRAIRRHDVVQLTAPEWLLHSRDLL